MAEDRSGEARPLGLVDGSVDATTRRFSLLLDERAVVQLDDLVAVTQELPDGRLLTHYGIVVEGFGRIEGAALSTDTRRTAGERTMPRGSTPPWRAQRSPPWPQL